MNSFFLSIVLWILLLALTVGFCYLMAMIIISVLEQMFFLQYETPIISQKRGKWINHRDDDGLNIADCEFCGNAMQWFDDDEPPAFCCMCGARLELGTEENDED